MNMNLRMWAGALLASTCLAGSAYAADMAYPTKAPPLTTPVPWVNVFVGFAAAPNSYFGDVGGVFALNRNLNTNGWLIRLRGGAGHYDYNRAVGLSQGVGFQVGEAMIGYQWFAGATRFSAYLGANVEHHNNSDPTATISGTKAGIKGQAEIYAPLTDRAYVLALGNYSSAWSSYFVMGKVGYRVLDRVSIGPEVAALGNTRFDAVRAGPFVSFDLTQSAQLILSGGYSWDTKRNALNDNSGAYGTIHLRSNF